MSPIELINDDCLVAMKAIPSASVDLTVTSPPYDNLRSYGGAMTWGEPVWREVLASLYRVTKPGGVVVWVVGDATVDGSETGSSFKQALHAMQCGFRLHDTMIWNKGGFSAVGALVSRYAPVFEYMFVFSKGAPKTFHPIKDKPNKWAGTKNHGTVRVDDDIRKPKSNDKVIQDLGQRFNIWDMGPQRQRGDGKHPAPFPEPLAYDHIVSWSNEGDTVLDPFLGSGTTAAAAARANRNCIGIEMNAEYFKIAQRRMGLSPVSDIAPYIEMTGVFA